MNTLVTFADFAELARRRGWNAANLVERFRRKIEQSRDFFECVLISTSKAKYGSSAIPYRSIIEFYWTDLRPLMADGHFQSCACGCGNPIYGRKKLASAACGKRMER